jgi:hypothetical protein
MANSNLDYDTDYPDWGLSQFSSSTPDEDHDSSSFCIWLQKYLYVPKDLTKGIEGSESRMTQQFSVKFNWGYPLF